MKRLSSSDSLGALMSLCPTTEEHSPGNNHMYGRDFQSTLDALDEEGCIEESGQIEKKRRLSVDQVKSLEKNFEVDNKLEPERKLKLAQELGLQPRQVAVWFQNRRARWKTKQLERDYGVLKANYDSLKHNYDTLQHDNDSLVQEIRELKAKFNGEKIEGNPVKEEVMACENKDSMYEEVLVTNKSAAAVDSIAQCDNTTTETNLVASAVTTIFQDGSSDSDSSAILNEDNNNSPNSSTGVFGHQFMPSSSSDCFQLSSLSDSKIILGDAQKAYQPQFVKIEEHDFFSGDESCNFFSDDQAPSLQWYCHDQWN